MNKVMEDVSLIVAVEFVIAKENLPCSEADIAGGKNNVAKLYFHLRLWIACRHLTAIVKIR